MNLQYIHPMPPSGHTLFVAALWDLSQHAQAESKENSLDKLPVQSNTQRVKFMLKCKCVCGLVEKTDQIQDSEELSLHWYIVGIVALLNMCFQVVINL